MFDQIFEFVGNHFILVSIFGGLLGAFIFNEGKRGGATVSSPELVNLINREQAVVLDVRDQSDFNAGHIVDAINIPFSRIDSQMADLEKHKTNPIIVVCKIGQHAGSVGKKLRAGGFERVLRLRGGIAEWQGANMPLVK